MLAIGVGSIKRSNSTSTVPLVSPMPRSALKFVQKSTRKLHSISQSFRIKQALNRCRLGAASGIPTFTTPDELEALFLLAEKCDCNSNALEIGSYLGASTCYIAAGLQGSHPSITCIDTWGNETMPEGEQDTFSRFAENTKSIREELILIRKYSSEVSRQELNSSFALIFLDGDHSYKQTRADFDLFSPLLAPTGVLVFHDSLFFEGVSRVLGEALASAKWQLGGTVGNLSWIKPARFEHHS